MTTTNKAPKTGHMPSSPSQTTGGKTAPEPAEKNAGNLAADQYSTPASLRKLRIRQGG